MERANILKTSRRCFNCLRIGRISKDCRSAPCSELGCKTRHHRLLHGAPRVLSPQSKVVSVGNITRETQQLKDISDCVLLNIAPVIIRAKDRELSTFALLDRGSEVSIIDATITKSLNLPERSTNMRVTTWHNKDPVMKLSLVSFEMMSTNRAVSFYAEDAVFCTIDLVTVALAAAVVTVAVNALCCATAHYLVEKTETYS